QGLEDSRKDFPPTLRSAADRIHSSVHADACRGDLRDRLRLVKNAKESGRSELRKSGLLFPRTPNESRGLFASVRSLTMADVRSPYLDALRERVLVFDGAMGTSIQRYDLTARDFGGERLEGCNDYLVISRPDVIEEIHSGYMEAGCDVLETDTFRSN